mmetsp:Transcript_4327/g.14218  ORF Transcript_4327/g.14218 Transcript_4327/m.14218 type:complete len:200 (-) Transcript_4327:567-1166(-)
MRSMPMPMPMRYAQRPHRTQRRVAFTPPILYLAQSHVLEQHARRGFAGRLRLPHRRHDASVERQRPARRVAHLPRKGDEGGKLQHLDFGGVVDGRVAEPGELVGQHGRRPLHLPGGRGLLPRARRGKAEGMAERRLWRGPPVGDSGRAVPCRPHRGALACLGVDGGGGSGGGVWPEHDGRGGRLKQHGDIGRELRNRTR